MEQRRTDLALVLENLSEELNISAILRTAEALGVGRVCLVYPEDKKPHLSRKASSGAKDWLEIEWYTSIADCITSLREQSKFKVVASIVEPSLPLLWDQAFTKDKIAVMVGNEAHGLSEEAIQLSDYKVYLPLFGLTESLNVSVAAALFLYEVVRQKEIG